MMDADAEGGRPSRTTPAPSHRRRAAISGTRLLAGATSNTRVRIPARRCPGLDPGGDPQGCCLHVTAPQGQSNATQRERARRPGNVRAPHGVDAIVRLSVLDLVPVRTDQSTADALAATVHAGADRRPAGFHSLLGRRTPQHAVRGRHQPTGADRLPGRADLAAATRIGRRDAAQPRAAGGGRAVRAAGSGRPGPHRPGHRPGARLRPGDVVRPARHQ